MAIGFQSVDSDENHLWIPRAQTRVFEKYDQNLDLVAQIKMPFAKGGDTPFEASEFNALTKKKKRIDEAQLTLWKGLYHVVFAEVYEEEAEE